jgi:hypothetical protein
MNEPTTVREDIQMWLAEVYHDLEQATLTEAEVDELARLDAMKRKTAHEL